jgi:hypothetical protein
MDWRGKMGDGLEDDVIVILQRLVRRKHTSRRVLAMDGVSFDQLISLAALLGMQVKTQRQ